jgi:predicted KAP-like P-loop ATPase
MWHDIEADVDLLNFGMVANAAAGLIRDAGETPLTIGVSGGWGAGKSTLVKLVRAELETSTKTSDDGHSSYILMEFNAWLYQGYEDARQALLQAVSDRLVEEAKKRKSFMEKAADFAKRIKLLSVGRIAAPVITHVAVGAVAAGPLGALFGAVSGLVQGFNDVDKREENLKAVQEAYTDLSPELKEVIGEKKESSLPKEIEGLRKAFEDLLEKLDVNLVVFVDDLDRCLPNTAIATLEAMRLLLHVKRTAFIIAADESMIRGAVRAHFKGVEIEEGLVTSYFDKLIQIPLRVPRLGTNEVKAYLALLLTDLAARKGRLKPAVQAKGQTAVLEKLRTWGSSISRDFLDKAFEEEKDRIATELDIADQLAPLLVTSAEIAGNPRLIKRFLNNLMIRRTVADAMKMPLALEELIKIQLFERCATSAAFEFLIKAVASSADGKADFLAAIEAAAEKAEEYVPPHQSWTGTFYEQWVKLNPRLAAKDLRPILHLSRDRSLGLAAYDELSSAAKKLLEATMAANEVSKLLVQHLAALGEGDVSRILTRAIRKAREDQWQVEDIIRCLNCTDAHPQLGLQLAPALAEIPGNKRDVALLPLLKTRPWAEGTLQNWTEDTETNVPARRYLQKQKGVK